MTWKYDVIDSGDWDAETSNDNGDLGQQEETVTIDDPMGYVRDIILKEAKQEGLLVDQLLYVMLSSKTNNPMNLAINAPTGEGKNWVLEKVAAVFPEDDVIFLHGMSDKALFHENGNFVIKATDIDFTSFNPQFDETLLDDFGYYQWDYVNKQIDKRLDEKVGLEDPNSKSVAQLKEEVEQKRKHLQQFVKKLINLEHKILIFLDTPRMSLFSALMPLLSHDRYEAEYKYVDTNAGIKTYKNLLRGWPCFIFAQAVDYSKHERWPEVQRRFIITNPKMDSKQKYQEAIHLIMQKNCLPDFIYQKQVVSDDEKQRAKEIVYYLCDKIAKVCRPLRPGANNIFVPYQEAVESALSKEQTSDMAAAKRFSAFLSLLPMINIHKRPHIIVHTDRKDGEGPSIETLPLATFDDLKDAKYITQYSSGVRPYILQWYYEILISCYKEQNAPASKEKMVGKHLQTISENRKGVTTAELIAATKAKNGKSYTSKQLHESFIYPLMNHGYIDSIPSEIDHRTNIYFPSAEEVATVEKDTKENIVFSTKSDNRQNSYEDYKVNLRDVTLFPDKEYIIFKIEGLLRLLSESHIDLTLCDHEGKETQVEALVNRYYQNPENYFNCSPHTDVDNTSDKSNGNTDVTLNEPNDKSISSYLRKQ